MLERLFLLKKENGRKSVFIDFLPFFRTLIKIKCKTICNTYQKYQKKLENMCIENGKKG